MGLFESKIDDNKLTDYNLIKIRGPLEGKYVEFKTEKDKKSSLREYLEKIRSRLRDMMLKSLVNGKYNYH